MQPKPDNHSILPLPYADWLFRRMHGATHELDIAAIPSSAPTVTIPDALLTQALRLAYGAPTPDLDAPLTLGDDPGGDPASAEPIQPPPSTLSAPRYMPIGKAARRKVEVTNANLQAEPA